MRSTIADITDMKFEEPRSTDEHFKEYFAKLVSQVTEEFSNLQETMRD